MIEPLPSAHEEVVVTVVREPAVAGRFYPAKAQHLSKEIDSYLSLDREKIKAIGCVAPHAGYMYSGRIAGSLFSKIEIPRRCIVLGPNHTGRGHPLAIMKAGSWRTPLGMIEIDEPLALQLMETFPAITEDSEAHRFEHAIEVEVPFLQKLRTDLVFVPIVVGTGQLVILEHLGKALAHVLHAIGEPILIVASSDMNHYENDARTRIKDRKAIDKILTLDARGLHETILSESISMCGFGPTVAMLTAAVKLGAQKAELVEYATSGDVSGDRDHVVGYAGIVIS
jgi:MEMO1 family protein